MNDQISRQKLIEELNSYHYTAIGMRCGKKVTAEIIKGYHEHVIEVIKSQPPADQWIPCDIARPTESGIYWATVEVYWCDEPVSIQLEYNHKKDEWIGGYDVLAWMPAILSEPYKGE